MYSPVLDSIREILDPYDFPICFGFPVGHVVDNYPMVLGSQVILDVKETKVRLNQS
jgi:muramoyltetrapeptide carboxypeptidase